MEFLNVDQNTFDDIQGTNDLEMIDNVTRISKRKARKVSKRSTRKAKKKTKKAARLTKRGKTKRASRLRGKASKITKRGTKRAKRIEEKGTLAERAAFAPLNPLKPMMIKTANSKGAKLRKKDSIVKVANEFYNRVVRAHSSFEEAAEIHLDAIDHDNIAPLVTGIVSTIIEFVRNAKKKKEEGKSLTKLESQTVAGAEVAEVKLEEKQKEVAAQEVGQKLLFDKKTQFIILGVILVIIAATVLIAKKKG